MISIIFFLIHFICYWCMVFIYDKNIKKNVFYNSVLLSLKNQIVYTLPLIYILFKFYPISYDNFLFSFLYIPILVITGDIYFYISHFPLHSRLLFKYHKTHHAGTTHVAKSLDADFMEHVFGNLGSFICGILILKYFNHVINIYVLGLWVGIITINVCTSHINGESSLNNGLHKIHHKKLNCNYGNGFYIMDKIFGTYKN
jgi:sterol desaturase/sphingolipid hydroxylase (fatty acid hydroxylase superfamily)